MHSNQSNSLSIPISKQTLAFQLIEPLTSLLKSLQTINLSSSDINSPSENQTKRLMCHLQKILANMAPNPIEILGFIQCIMDQAKEVHALEHESDTKHWLSILIIDDDERIQKFHSSILKSLNCITNTAYNGYEALSMMHRNYDAIVMDIRMPGMDGFETEKRIRQLGFRKTPIIATTTTNLSDIEEEFKISTFDDFLQKPLDLTKLRSSLCKLTKSPLI